MAPVSSNTSQEAYDYLVIGGGSGGLASARRAAGVYGQKVAIVEGSGRLGGTCVNVGCVPKKVMWYTADLASKLREAPEYGFTDVRHDAKSFDWSMIKNKRDSYVKRLNGIYEKNLDKDSVEWISGYAKFTGKPGEVEVDMHDGSGKKTVSAKKILIAVGGAPNKPSGIPGAELGINSDGFFELEKQPERVLIVGAGYIAVEFAGIFNALGSQTHMFIRHDKFLRPFDPLVQDTIVENYENDGIKLHRKTNATKLEKTSSGRINVTYKSEYDGESSIEVDTVIWAIGRTPETDRLNLESVGVKTNKSKYVEVDEYQNTNVENVYALGDVCGKVELTPVAIAAGRKLADRLFGNQPDAKLDYDLIPSVVFAHPEVGNCGLTQPQAEEKYGKDNIKVYTETYNGMYYAVLDHKVPTKLKMICAGPEEKVVGLHIIGQSMSEVLQGFAVAMKMGATRKDFNACVAIHPTSAEDLVLLK
ncbi:Glutathione reductase [Savitreella phatthalungensis]